MCVISVIKVDSRRASSYIYTITVSGEGSGSYSIAVAEYCKFRLIVV